MIRFMNMYFISSKGPLKNNTMECIELYQSHLCSTAGMVNQ